MVRSFNGALWRISLTALDADAALAATPAFDELCQSVSAYELPNGDWCVEGLTAAKPDLDHLSVLLTLLREGRDAAPGEIRLDRLPPRDWLGANQSSFPPIRAGRYFIYGSHYRAAAPRGKIGLLIDAATAFGTGEHATTRGCLLALDGLARRGRRHRVLDMGTGTGVLAMAAAKTWRRQALGRDIDPESVRVARHNAFRNGVADLIEIDRSDGYRDRLVTRRAPYDLVFANILARPLAQMAKDLERVLAPGGVAILSGLLGRQEPFVLAAHRLVGLRLKRRIAIAGWHTLLVGR